MSQAEAPPAIEYERVSFSYSGRADNGAGAPLALDRVSLTVRKGERLGILGPNGGGKSTLLKLTLGLLAMQEGSIRVLGREPGRARRDGLIGYVPQRNEAELAFPVSVRQAVSMAAERGLAPWRRLGADARRRVERSIALVAAEEFADRPVGRLSGGQLQRAVIARALASNPKVLLLDEPTVGVDVSGQQRFGELMTTLQRELGLTIVAHETNDFLAYESITRAHTGAPNVFISRSNATGEAAVHGNGFYTAVGKKGARGSGITIRFTVDPDAREGVDFFLTNGGTTGEGAYIVWLNRNAKGELWLNAKASKFADKAEGEGDKRPRRSRARKKSADGEPAASEGEGAPAE